MQITPEQAINSNNRQQAKLSWKRREALQLANALRQDVEENYGMRLPYTWQEYNGQRQSIVETAGYDLESWDGAQNEIIKLQYCLRNTNKAIYATFEDHGVLKSQLVSAWYTKHRMDPVWLWRKSQLIRKAYRQYLTDARDPAGNMIKEHYTPCHLVLTLPHDETGYQGQRFYLKELLQLFHEMRRQKGWKNSVYGGEYGAEITKGKNGLHIHIHSLIFLNDSVSINNFRDWLQKSWARITDNPGRAFIHLEQLFIYKRDENGNFETKTARKKNEKGEYEDLYKINFDENDLTTVLPLQVRKKTYIGQDSSMEDYINGIMECIKYHFKPDSYKDDKGAYDIDLIRDILNNSKKVRFYSRFGAFYKVPELNFSYKGEDTASEEVAPIESEEEVIESEEEKLMGKSGTAIANLINPFTMQPAKEGDYNIAVATPENLRYSPKSDLKPYELAIYSKREFYNVLDTEVNKLIQYMLKGQLDKIYCQALKDKGKNLVKNG